MYFSANEEYKGVSSSMVRENIVYKKEFLTLIPDGAKDLMVKLLNEKNF